LLGCEILGLNDYQRGTFPEEVVNLGNINSADDDYNSTAPSYGDVVPLVFSSKRGGRDNFDFVQETLDYSFSRKTGKFAFDNSPYWGLSVLQEQAPIAFILPSVNSDANELGPYLLSYERDLIRDGYNRHYAQYLMLFASDKTGNLDVYLTHNYLDPPTSQPASPVSTTALTDRVFANPVPLPFLNSPADDAYPTFDKGRSAIYFTSNRAGSFAIYKTTLPQIAPTELQVRLPTLTDVPVERVAEFASAGETKCPFIQDETMVFTSNRSGGYGGYDLYYSKWDGSHWSAPVNFGPSINTSYDEYRPILHCNGEHTNKLLIFSSNRPGGKGDFDLYRAGVSL
jgi:hypothetical protein